MSLPTRRYRRFIDAAAELVGLPGWTYRGQSFFPGELLEGLILAESGGDPRARRYEPHQDRSGRRDAATDADTPDQDDGALEDDASYGLMQVMGYNLRRLVGVAPGVRMDFEWAFLPIANVSAGLRILLEELRAVDGPDQRNEVVISRALARYNGGPTGDDRDDHGVMRRQPYVDRIHEHARRVRSDRIAELNTRAE